MVSARIEPDAVAYDKLIQGYCKIGRIDDGLSLFREMSCKDVKPTTVTYNIILHGLFDAGRTVAAKEKFHEMAGNGMAVNIQIFTTV